MTIFVILVSTLDRDIYMYRHEADVENSVHTLTMVFHKNKNSRIFTFAIYIWNNDPRYYTSPETLALVNLFGVIKGGVYRNI